MKLTPELIEELKNTDSITKRDQIVKLISDKTQKIIEAITKAFHKKNYWWSWEWCDNDDPQPRFSVSKNIKKSYLDYSLNDVRDYLVHEDKQGNTWDLVSGCPIAWLYDDNFEQDLLEGIKRFKDREKNANENKKKRIEELKAIKQRYAQIAKSKLTPEELWATGLSTKIPKSLKGLAVGECDI